MKTTLDEYIASWQMAKSSADQIFYKSTNDKNLQRMIAQVVQMTDQTMVEKLQDFESCKKRKNKSKIDW